MNLALNKGLFLAFAFFAVTNSTWADEATDQATAAANLQKLQSDAEKAKWDAAKARADYQNSLPAPAESGAVTVKTNAGQLEGNVLTAEAVNTLATTIANNAKSKIGQPETCDATPSVGCKSILLLSGSESALFVHWDQFKFRHDRLKEAFRIAMEAFNNAQTKYRLNNILQSNPTGGGGASVQGFTPDSALVSATDITGIGTAASAITKLVGYFMRDYEVGGVATSADDAMLIAAVASKMYGTHQPTFVRGRLLKPGAADEVFAFIKGLDDTNIDATKKLADLKKITGDAQKKLDDKKSTEAEKKKAQETIATFKEAIELLTAATGGYQTFITSLSQSDAATGLPLPLVIQEKAESDMLGTEGAGLFLHVQSSGGAYYTEHSIWTIFTNIPFYVSGGAVVNYVMIDRKSGAIIDAGLLNASVPYKRLDKVAH
jgi:hypothetical protein